MCLKLRNDFSKANFSFHFFELRTDPIRMSETKSYGISLSFSDRISLYISGALSWSQFKNNDTFYIKQSEIQFLTNARLNKNKFVCFFERDYKIECFL